MRAILTRTLAVCYLFVAAGDRPGSYAADGQASPPAVGDKAADFTLSDLEGNQVSLSDLTERGPVAVVVLRGSLGGGTCPFCTRQFSELLGTAKDFEKAAATVVVIYPGAARDLDQHAKQFVGGQRLPKRFHFLLDPDFEFAHAYGARSKGPGATTYPASFVVDGDGVVRFARVGRTPVDRPSAATLLAALPDKN
jgi:peroxiredoxin